jgi:beta-glucosidase
LVAPATGSFEFGLAVYGSANFYIDDELVIENTTVQRGGNFFGKGTLEEKVTIDLVKNQAYKLKVEFISGASSKLVKPGVVNFGGGACRLGMIEVIDCGTGH